MNKYFTSAFKSASQVMGAIFIILLSVNDAVAQTTIPSGSFIINMGVTPQTINNGTKPYGLLYQLLSVKCPVHWVINPNKTTQDAVDFTYNGVAYKSGAFIVEAQYRTATVNALISTWTNPALSYKVIGVTTTSPLILTFPIFKTLYSIPRWTLDQQNGSLALAFFNYASIPPVAYGGASSSNWPLPSTLDCCDDLFIMPHADPTWLTHRNLYTWNESCLGAIWLGCHAGSALENMFDNLGIAIDGDPFDANQQTNFLTEKSGPAVGGGPWSDPGNALILWGDHGAGTLPYIYNNTYASDPVAQYLGAIDAATQNGSEQIYIPAHASAGWRPTTKVLVYDPNHPDALNYPNPTPATHVGTVLAYGPGLGESDRANVMLEASHSVAKATAPANVAGMRAFFNFSYLSSTIKVAIPEMNAIANPMYSGVSYECSFAWYGGKEPLSTPITIEWASSCDGTFSPNNTSQTVNFIPDAYPTPVNCQITVTVTDACGRVSFDTHSTVFQCNLQVTTDIVNPCFNTPNGGSITMNTSGGLSITSYSWTKNGGVPVTGSGNVISGLSEGTYTVTATASNGCTSTFTVTLTQSPQIVISAIPVPVGCNGTATGSINTTVSGGIPGYTYSWTGPGGFTSNTLNLSGLFAGDYTLTVTDSKLCTASGTVTVTQPLALTITPTTTNVTCNGENNGIINLAVTGGTSPYTYLWNDGNSSQNRTGLAAGNYDVTVTDANSCIATASGLTITEPASALALSETHINNPCYGNSLGSIDLSVSGGTGPYTYDWADLSTAPEPEDRSTLAAGNYSVTVTDAKGCTANLNVTITQPTALAINLAITDPTCPPDADQNSADGAINLTVTGGTAPYTIDWHDIAGTSNDEDRAGLIAGAYTVTVTDANGCSITTSETLEYLNPNPAQPGSIKH